MKTQPIDWDLVGIKQDNLAGALGFAWAGFGEGAASFFEKFRRSGWMARFERNEGRATIGCSGTELALMIYDQSGRSCQRADFEDKCNFDTITSSVEYWIGYALGYLQGRSDTPFNQIFRRFPIGSWYNLYSLHEVSDETLWDKTLGSKPGDTGDDAEPQQTSEPYTFGGRQHPFSNYYPAPTVYDGMAFSTSEAAFQSAKTHDADARRAFINIDPGKAKRDGRSLSLRPDWEQVKYQVMLDVLSSKFQDPVLRQMLLDTGDRLIIEDTTGWHDNEWGDCHCEKCRYIAGRNMLGKALMEIRSTKLKG